MRKEFLKKSSQFFFVTLSVGGLLFMSFALEIAAQDSDFTLLENDREILIYDLRSSRFLEIEEDAHLIGTAAAPKSTGYKKKPSQTNHYEKDASQTTPSKVSQLGQAVAEVLADQIKLLSFVQTEKRLRLFSFSNSASEADWKLGEPRAQKASRQSKILGYTRFDLPAGVSKVQPYARLRVKRLKQILPIRQESGKNAKAISADYRLSGSILRLSEEPAEAVDTSQQSQRKKSTKKSTKKSARKSREKSNNIENSLREKYMLSLVLFNENTGQETSFQETIEAPVLENLEAITKKVITHLAGVPLLDLQIRSNPPGQLVYFNQAFFGETPVRRWFPLGIYDMEIRSDRGAWLSQKMNLYAMGKGKSAVSLFYRMSAIAKPVNLKVESEPSGAQVFLDEEYLGKTPLSFSRDSGKGWLRLRLGGYEEYLDEVSLDQNSESENFRKIYLKRETKTSGPYAEDHFESAERLLYTFLGFYAGWLYFTVEGNRFASQTAPGSVGRAQAQYNLASISAGVGIIALIASTSLFIVALDSNTHRRQSSMQFGTRWTAQGKTEYRASYHTSF